MIEPVMYFGIGFLVAALLGLLFVPLVHNRAVRLTMRRLEAATPLSVAEIRADKDQLRAEFAMSTRRLELSVEQMKAKTTNQLAELGKKADAINHLKKELGEKTATIFALESRDKALRDQLRATEEEFEHKSGALREAERALSDKQADLAKLVAELGERSIMADSQRVELAALRTQVEAMKVSVTDYERAVRVTEERLARERSEAEAATAISNEVRGKLDEFAARTAGLERELLVHTTEAEVLGRRVQELEGRLGDQGRQLAEREFEIGRLRSDIEAAAKVENDLRAELENAGSRSSGAADKLRADVGQLEAQLGAAVDERNRLQREHRQHETRGGNVLGDRARRKRHVARAYQRRGRRGGPADRGAGRSGLADRVDPRRGGSRARRGRANRAVERRRSRCERRPIPRSKARARSPTAFARCKRRLAGFQLNRITLACRAEARGGLPAFDNEAPIAIACWQTPDRMLISSNVQIPVPFVHRRTPRTKLTAKVCICWCAASVLHCAQKPRSEIVGEFDVHFSKGSEPRSRGPWTQVPRRRHGIEHSGRLSLV